MKESAEEKARQEKLTRYLLGETEDEERLEIEKLCNQKQEWRQDKQRISRTLSLMEDACSEPLKELDGTSLQLSEEQRSKVLATLKNREPSDPLPEPKNPDQDPQKNEGKNLKLNFWIPLGAAATAMIIAYLGSVENNKPSETARAEPSSEKEKVMEEGTDSFAKTEATSPEVDFALQERIQEGAIRTLAKRTTEEVLAMKEELTPSYDMLPNKKEVTAEGAKEGVLNSSSSLANEPILPEPSSTAPPPAPFKASGAGISPEGLYQALGNPSKAFLLTLRGDSLGKIAIRTLTDNRTLRVERANWPDPSRSFALPSERYELRLFAKEGAIYVLRGELRKHADRIETSESLNYEFSFSEAWILGKDEIRKAIALPKP